MTNMLKSCWFYLNIRLLALTCILASISLSVAVLAIDYT